MRKRKIITGLDIGSSAVKVLVAGLAADGVNLEVLAQTSEPSFGIRRGVVVDVEKISEIVANALGSIEKEWGQPIKEVFVNIGGAHIFSSFSRGAVAVSRADQKISQEDIERVLQSAQTFSLPPNREILEVFPKEFIVDGERGIKEVLGMEGVRLESEVLVMGCFSPYLKNLERAVLGADYQIAEIICGPLASSRAVLNPRERELGALVLDIGAGTSGFAVFVEKNLVQLGIIPIGSGHITNDIAIGLRTDIDTAELIKVGLAACGLKGAKKLKQKEKASGEFLEFSQTQLGRIVDARAIEIFEQIQKELKQTDNLKLPGGVVLTGGGAKLPKIKDLAKSVFRLSCRIGKPTGFFPKIDDPQWSCASGLILEGKGSLTREKGWARTIIQGFKRILGSFIP